MKLFKKLLVAPATLGLLAPLSVIAGEANLNDISKYSKLGNVEFTNAFVNDDPNEDTNNSLLIAGGEGLVEEYSHDGGFSSTTTASFSLDTAIGSIDGDTTTEAVVFEYQYNIGLSTTFTGEDSLDVAIDSGSAAAATGDNPMAFDTGAALTVDGVTYSFPLLGFSMIVGNDTDLSASFTGACSYTAFTDYMSDCGTVNSIGKGGNGFTTTGSYEFGSSGLTLAGGFTSTADAATTAASKVGILTKEGTDSYGFEAAYTADSWGLAVAYVYDDNNTSAETTSWGINGTYTFDDVSILPSVSAGYETQNTDTTAEDPINGYFFGLTWDEAGPGSFSLGAATAGNFADKLTDYMIYEASYSYPVNDGLTITPGVYIKETSGDDLTGIIVKSSFAF